MEIVINIPDLDWSKVKNGSIATANLLNAIRNGTPLPKGHGRLIDVNDIEWARHQEEKNYIDYDVVDWDDIVKAPTILEADTSMEDEE